MKMQRDFGGGKLHRVSATLNVPTSESEQTIRILLDKQQLPGILIGGTCPGVSYQLTGGASCEMRMLTLLVVLFRLVSMRVTDASPPLPLTTDLKSIYSEEAVEYGELETFLRLKDTWDETIEETRPTLPAKPIGVPGASSPSQMAKPAHRALFNASPGGGPSSPLRGPGVTSSSSSASASAAAASPSPAETKKSLRNRNEAEFDVGDELTGYGLQGVKVTDDDLLALVEELGLGGEEAGDLVKGLSDPTDKADKVKEDEVTEVREGGGSDDGGGAGGSEQPESKSEASAEAKPVAHEEEVEATAEGDGVEKTATAAESEVAETDAGTPSA
jgi:hypothetical protein